MNGEKPKPQSWQDVKKGAEENIKAAEMNLAIAKAILMTANRELQKK